MTTQAQVRLVTFVLLAVLSAGVGLAQPARGNDGSVEGAIRSLEEQERVAVLNRDVDALKRLWSERMMVNAPGNKVSPNRDVPLGMVQSGAIHYTVFERTIEALRVDGDMAVVMGAEVIQPTGQAPQAGRTVRRRFSHIWTRESATWRLVARHANIVAE